MEDQEKRQPNIDLRRERDLRGWSQRVVAEYVGTTEQVVTRWESGQHKPNRHFQTQLCSLFEKSAEELGFMRKQGASEKEETQNNEVQKSPLLLSLATLSQELEGTDLDKLRRLLLKELGLVSAVALAPLVVTQPLVTALNEELISKANTTIMYCWQLYYSGGAFLLEQFLPTFLSQLIPLVQQSSKYQQALATITSHAYQLFCELATDQENYGTALNFGQQAFMYAKNAENIDLQASVLVRLGNLYFHRKQSLYSLRAYQQALPLLDNVSPLLRGRVYAGLAEVFAMRNQEQEALSYIGLAHDYYPTQPEHDPAYPYTHISQYSLYVFGEGQTRLYLNQPKEAQKTFTYVEKHLLTSEPDMLSRVDLLYYQTEASCMLGDLESSCAQVQAAVELAKNANSRLYYTKILATYQEMRKKWQHESKMNELEELFQPW